MTLYILLSLILVALLYVIHLIISIQIPPSTVCRFEKTQIPQFECKHKDPPACRFEKPAVPHQPVYQFSSHPRQELQILQKSPDGQWVHYAWRHSTSYDLSEYLNTPGFAIKHPNGVIEEGVQ